MATTEPNPKYYQKGTFTLGNRLAHEADCAPSAPLDRSKLKHCGHTTCAGCGVRLAARYVAATLQMTGYRGEVLFLDQSGDDAPAILERDQDLLCLCYDTEGAGAEPGNLFGAGKAVQFARMHAIRYVATATIADLHDLERKLEKAIGLRGMRYVHIHAPCPAVWGTPPRETVHLARLAAESGFFPVFEAENGVVTASRKLRHRVPISAYLKPRLSKLGPEGAAELQAMSDRNTIEFNLLREEGEA